MKGVNSKDNKSDPYDNSTNNSVVTMNANAVTSETQTSNSSDNAASSKNTQFPDNKQMPGNAPGSIGGFDMDADESCVLTINGGTVTINADGDGIDSNGYFYINGGTVYVEGPESKWQQCLGLRHLRNHYRWLLPVNRILRHGAELQLGFYPVFLHADAFIKYQRNDHRYFDRC